ncbi:MAG: MBOAT family O-acyltransferase [Pirellulales bacterium]
MIFNTAAYYLLFLIPAAVAFRIASAGLRPWICAFSGIAFYLYFSLTQHGGVWGAACVLIFAWESLFRSLYRPRAKACIGGVLISLGVLAAFKYWNFFTDLATTPFGENQLRWERAFLPLGVSFFTFEFIHYAVDRYQGKAERGSLGEYLAFIFFFPTMVAGPIKRFQDFLPCLRRPSDETALDWNRGITRILTGLVKKLAVADFLTSLTDHLNAEDIAVADRRILLVWLFAYGWKIYFDFSAYSDIAIGSARLFGVRVPENFDWPYFRTNIAEFWKHWHISLYRWLVDYVFIPLGGSRTSQLRACANIAVVMLVSGLWHGAALNFLVWGAWHAGLLIIHRLWSSYAGGMSPESRLPKFAAWLLTYVSVNLGWAFFAMDLKTAALFFRTLFFGRSL